MHKLSVSIIVSIGFVLCAAAVDAVQWPITGANFNIFPPNDYATYAMVTPNGYHTGMDIIGPADPCLYNTQVVAGVDGTVVLVQPIQQCLTPPVGSCPGSGCPDQGLGNSVTLLGNNGVYYTYGHLDSIDANLQLGQVVGVATPIGIMGNSSYGVPRHGYCPGVPACGGGQDFIPHLHFESKTSLFIGTGYYPNAPDFGGYQDAAREIYGVASITPMVIRLLTSQLSLQGVPSSQFYPSAVANAGVRFVAYEQAGSWLHVHVPAVRLLPPELWIPTTLAGCPNGQCVANEPLSPLLVRVVSPPADGGVTARDQPSMSGTRTARLWNGQMLVVLARQAPQVGDTCTGEWFQLQAAQPYGNSVPAVWACSRIKDKIFLEVREPCDANGQCTTPGVCQSGPGTCTATGCEYPTTVGAACDDGDACTANDTCDATTLCAGTQVCVPTSTPTRTPTATPTRTPTGTVTPTLTPTSTAVPGQVCTTFAMGVCCDSADGTNCRSPVVACADNTGCAAQTPYTTCAGASGDDGMLVKTASSVYPPNTTTTAVLNSTAPAIRRNFNGATYNEGVLEVRFNTAALPDAAIVTTSTLTLQATSKTDTNGLNLRCEWFDWSPTIDTGEYTELVGNSGCEVSLASLTAAGAQALSLSSGGNISLTGYTYLRCGISQRAGNVAPSGDNQLTFATFDHTTVAGPSLQVCYVLPTPTLVPSLTPTATASAPLGPTATATPTDTPTATATDGPPGTPPNTTMSTATLTATITPSATATVSPTNTNTATATSTATQVSSSTPTLTSTQTRTSSPTASSTVTPTQTPPRTPTPTPTPTAPPAQVCTTFATGVCCDSADGTNCRSPVVACADNTGCVAQTPYTTCAGASGDDGMLVKTASSVYPPNTTTTAVLNSTAPAIRRNFNGTTYNEGVLEVRFNTAALPDAAIPTTSTLTLQATSKTDTNGLNLRCEWFDWSPTIDTGEYTELVGNSGCEVSLASLTAAGAQALSLSSGGNISLTGYTYLRCGISQRAGNVAPSGDNQLTFATFDHTTVAGPSLQVCYVLPTPTLVPSLTPTATASAPLGPTATATPTSTATTVPTDTPTLTPTSAPTATSTQIPTPTATTTPTETMTAASTSTSTATATDTATSTASQAAAASSTPTINPTETPASSPIDTPTQTPPLLVTPTSTGAPTDTPTLIPTSAPTATSTEIPTPTATTTPTETMTAPSTSTSTATATDTATSTATQAVASSTPTINPTETPASSPTDTPTQTPTLLVTPTSTGASTDTPTLTPTVTATALPTSTDSPTVTATAIPPATASGTPTLSATVTATAPPSTSTPTATRTPTPTGTPVQVCTTFATGVCCDSTDGTNCKSPALVCNSNPACAGQAPYTICAGAVTDNAQAASTAPTTYANLAFSQCWVGTASIGVSRSFGVGTYAVNDGLLQWDTSALPDTAVMTSATLTVVVSGVNDTDARNFQGEWFNWGASCDAADWTLTAASTAFSVRNSTIVVNATNTLPLTGLLGNINPSGRTYLRLHESGGQPTGPNRVILAGYANTSQPGPRLQVCYVLSTPTPTATP